jgi:ribonuclease HI
LITLKIDGARRGNPGDAGAGGIMIRGWCGR